MRGIFGEISMIAFLRGKIFSKSDSSVTLDVNGVGYEVFLGKMSLVRIGEVGDDAALEIHSHFTESAAQLYGFLSADEKSLFRKLISISGIGPKMGLNIISAYVLEDIVTGIVRGDLAMLSAISGVGKKTAERIVIELKDKLKNFSFAPRTKSGVEIPMAVHDQREQDALQALLSLGYAESVARKALLQVGCDAADTVQTLIKKSLGAMAS